MIHIQKNYKFLSFLYLYYFFNLNSTKENINNYKNKNINNYKNKNKNKIKIINL